MTQSIADQYRRWFDYEKDSHAKVFTSLEAVNDQLRSSPLFQKALDLMAHLAAARRMWLFRFGVTSEKVELFPSNVSLAELRANFAEMEAAWSGYLGTLNDTEIRRVFEYQSYEGLHFSNTIADILTQLFGHSWYHRGQIAQLLRIIGAEPPVTDFVFWARERVGQK
ncbi:MAG: DinB family protein [Pyrinomonadaceae bacterium]